MTTLIEKIRTSPKAELHLRGALPVRVMDTLRQKYSEAGIVSQISRWQKLAARKFPNISQLIMKKQWNREDMEALFTYKSFTGFLFTFYFTRYFIRDAEDLQFMIDGVIDDLKAQSIVHAEITITVRDYVARGIPLESVKKCMDSVDEHKDISVRWLVDLVRGPSVKQVMKHLDEMIGLQCRTLAGVNFGGMENLFASRKFGPVFDRARAAGLRVTVHAGEARGARSVREAVELFGAERIGHGVRAVEDGSVVQLLAEKDIPLEVCPTSNIFTGVYPSYSEHPLKKLFDAGVPVTISSDDPVFFKTNLVDEYRHAYEAGFSEDEILELMKNGFIHSFMDDGDKEVFIKKLEKEWLS